MAVLPQNSDSNEPPEPWLRGPIVDVHPFVMPVFFSFVQVREDLAKHTASLTQEQLWRKVGKTSLGFHLKHLAGSVERLTTYLTGHPLSQEQLQSLRAEGHGSEGIQQLSQVVEAALQDAEEKLRSLRPDQLYEQRTVGRKNLPTTLIGLLVHIAEHTQRHLGQIIILSQIVQQKEQQ